eukprot:symbB.v1.2.000836.t1/scaffold37.1/size397765/8
MGWAVALQLIVIKQMALRKYRHHRLGIHPVSLSTSRATTKRVRHLSMMSTRKMMENGVGNTRRPRSRFGRMPLISPKGISFLGAR